MILTPLQKLPNNVVDLGKIIVATGFECLPKSKNLPNLVTLAAKQGFASYKQQRESIGLDRDQLDTLDWF